ncbi:Tetratricopeptide repeat-containing protein [Arsukibacterium tuosuense]|uniref:Tetratricopeptide repeat-containing protein n=1 Tax=Arsukibacterium tuosuense TaxID=1323745 RepID=A0A285J8W1_9GAMM|nr:sulfotransferase [Arsukibacterium tuosuense]SNY56740.1 Tetratricopeptide repeat-containing protein [Arsukibacterium tuosuense]
MTEAAHLLTTFYQAVGQKNPATAARTVQQLITNFPQLADSWLAASVFAEHTSQLSKALQAIDKAVTLSPDIPRLQLRRLHCLQRCHQTAAALQLADHLSQTPAADADFLSELALQCSQLQRYKQAARLYQQALALQPDNATLYYNYATMLRFCGQLATAEQMLDKAIDLQPRDTDAWHLRSSLRKQRTDNHHCAGLTAMLQRQDLSPKQRVQLHYALAKELEDLKQYPQSFTQLQAGATLRRNHINYQLAADLAVMQEIQQQFDQDFFRQARPQGCDNPEPVFIVSMPRAGSTLAERMLGCDPQVQLAGELNNFATQLSRLAQLQAEKKLDKAALVQQTKKLDFAMLGQAYLDSTRPLTGRQQHFVDKLPLNFLYVGLIHLALPRARIIHVQRNPIDHCYAIYKHLFADAYPFSYQLDELVQYYQAYQALMAHWQRCLPGVIHTVQYEELVSQPAQSSQALYQYCGLPWNEHVLQFHQHNQQASTTGSASQVRQPLYNSSVARWRCYQTELAELVSAFPDAV